MRDGISLLEEKHRVQRLRRDDDTSRFVGSLIVQQQNFVSQVSHIIDSFDSMQSEECIFEPKLLLLNAIEVVSISRLSLNSSIKLRTDPSLPHEVRGDMNKF